MSEKTKTKKTKKMIHAKDWESFRRVGLLWWVNRILHTFGWALVVEIDDKTGKVTNAYPARTKFRGFDHETEDQGFKRVSEFMRRNGERLRRECDE